MSKNKRNIREQDIKKPAQHEAHQAQVQQQVEQDTQSRQAAAPVEAAVEVLQQLRQIIEQLKAEQPEAALEALAQTLGRLEILTARYPELELLPLGQRRELIDVHGDMDAIKTAEKEVRELLDKGEIQAARRAMRYLASELVIYTDYLPLVDFPTFVRSAVPLIDKGELSQAQQVLVSALNRVVTVENVIPLPLVRAQALLNEARKLTEEEAVDKEEALALIESARYQIQMLELLGYGDVERDYPELYDLLTELEGQVKGEQSSKAAFKRLDEAISQLRERLFHRQTHKPDTAQTDA